MQSTPAYGPSPSPSAGPAPHYSFVIYCAAVGPYFKTGQLSPIDLIVETQFHRAAPGGMGGTKCAGERRGGRFLLSALEESVCGGRGWVGEVRR